LSSAAGKKIRSYSRQDVERAMASQGLIFSGRSNIIFTVGNIEKLLFFDVRFPTVKTKFLIVPKDSRD